MKRCFGLALAGAALLAACSGSTSTLGGGGGSAAVNGKAGGTAVDAVEAVGLVGTQMENGTTASYAGVAITNIAGTCALLQRHGNPKNAQALTMEVVGTGTSIAPGTYAVGGQTTPFASAAFDAQDATCTSTTNEQATSGSVVLTAVSSASIDGSFDLTFPGGDHLTGSFTAPVCKYDLTSTSGTSACGS
jgi:hypothetical protein